MKKLLFLALIPMLFVVLASGCKSECERNHKTAKKMQKSINKAVAKEDFVKAHQYLGELLLLQCVEERQEASIRDVYLAEIRFLVAKNDESSWNRAQMLPMEVPNGFETVQKELYKSLYDYAVAFDNEEIKEKAEKALAYLEGDRMIMPVSTSISGPLGEFFEVVDSEEGYKMVVDEEKTAWRWSLTVEIKRIKEGKTMKGGVRNDHGYIGVNLLDEDNAVIEYVDHPLGYFHGFIYDFVGLKVGESKIVSFGERYDYTKEYQKRNGLYGDEYVAVIEKYLTHLKRVKTVSKFEVTSAK
jgi:hypothetical protein